MKFLALFSGVLAASASTEVKSGINKDLEKVVQLLEDMQKDAVTAQNEGEASHEKNKTRLSNAIEKAERAAANAAGNADAAKAASQAAQAKIDEHTQTIEDAVAETNLQKDNKKAAKEQRTTAKADYTANFEDAQLGITACERLIDALDDIKDQSTAGSFLQEKMKLMPNMGRAKVLMQAVEKFNQPQVVYKADDKFKEIVNMIETLKGELEADLTQINEEEANSVAAHNMKVQASDNTIKNKQAEKRENEDGKAQQEETKGQEDKTEESELAEENAQNLLAEDLKKEKKQAIDEYKQADDARTSEIDAIKKAIGILSENAVATEGQNTGEGASLLQIKRTVNEDGKAKALNFLRKQASKLHSKSLLMITEVASEDPFAKVKQLIESLITRLTEEGEAAQTKHDKCVADMKDNENAIKESKNNIEEYTNEIDAQTATINKEDITIQETDEDLKVCRDDREEGQKFFNERTAELVEILHDGKATHEALGKALDALSAGAEDAAAGGPGFSGTGGLATIIDFMTHIQEKQNDANVATETEKDDLAKSWKEEERKLNDVEASLQDKMKAANESKATAEEAKTTAEGSLDLENDNMTGLKKQKIDIEKVCVAQGASHAENKAKREAEIQSLEEALEILKAAN